MLRIRWPLVVIYLAVSLLLVAFLLPRMGTEIFPDANAPLMRLRMRAPTGTRIEVTERLFLRALDVLNREIGPGNVEITSDFLGLIPSSYPVDLIHLFTSGPQEADHPSRDEARYSTGRGSSRETARKLAQGTAGVPVLIQKPAIL